MSARKRWFRPTLTCWILRLSSRPTDAGKVTMPGNIVPVIGVLELYDRMWAQPDFEGTPWMQIRILARS